MKRRGKFFLTAGLLLVAGLLAVLFWRVRPLTGHISAFRYRSGHYWYGHHTRTIFEEDGSVYAKLSYEPGSDNELLEFPEESWEMTVALTDEETTAFDHLILETLRLPDWEERYDDLTVTDQDSWSITYTWDGQEYSTSGYAVFPDGLSQIRDFFVALDWPDQPG